MKKKEYNLEDLLKIKTMYEIAKMIGRTFTTVQAWRNSIRSRDKKYKVIRTLEGWEVWELKQKNLKSLNR